MKLLLATACSVAFLVVSASAQQSPSREASASIGGKSLTIRYDAPSVRGRSIFGEHGRISKDPNYPVWRAGANNATILQTGGDLDINGLAVPKGSYSLYVLVQDPNAWQLIVNKQTGQWGLTYDQSKDLGRVKMNMSKPPALVEQLSYAISSDSAKHGKIELAWEQHIASVPVTLK